MEFVCGPGTVTGDHAGRTVVVGQHQAAYRDDLGRLVVVDEPTDSIIGSEWNPRDPDDDLPPVRIVGLQPLSDGTVELVISPVDLSSNFVDEYEEPVTARALSAEAFLSAWCRADGPDAAENVNDILRKLERLG